MNKVKWYVYQDEPVSKLNSLYMFIWRWTMQPISDKNPGTNHNRIFGIGQE